MVGAFPKKYMNPYRFVLLDQERPKSLEFSKRPAATMQNQKQKYSKICKAKKDILIFCM